MRITQKIIFDDFLRDVNRNRSQMGTVKSQLSSGKTVRLPSNDPIAFQRARNIEESMRKSTQYQDNISSGLRQARLAQDAMDGMIDRLVDVKRITTAGVTASASESARISMADEVKGMRDAIVASLNVSYGNRYLFAGTNSGEPPFVLDGAQPNGVENRSNGVAPSIVVADGVRTDVSVSGQELVNSPAGDLFDILHNVEQALRGNDTDALRDLMPKLDTLIDHSSISIASLGGSINRMEFMFEQYESTNIGLETDISRLVDTDFARAMSDMQRIDLAYESALAVQSKMINNTLLNYL
jgi:flagellar hook-associated protein 3 FlgL